jgi:hypothetical protein
MVSVSSFRFNARRISAFKYGLRYSSRGGGGYKRGVCVRVVRVVRVCVRASVEERWNEEEEERKER